MIWIGIIILLFGGLFIYISQRKKQSQSKLAKTEVRPVKEIKPGETVELEGKIEASHPLQTPFSKQDCVYYEYELEKEVEKEDKEGRVVHDWERVKSGHERINFNLRDGTGSIKIISEKAKIEARDLGEKFIGRGEPLGDSTLGKIFDFIANDKYRTEEKALLNGTRTYIYGQAMKDKDEVVIKKGNNDFIISYRSEEEVEKSMAKKAMIFKVLGFIGIIGGVVLAVYSFFI
ncbi:MAG: GIDE domain-containing protein [Patescibacteria group bacterium]|nr:GIDE domain-containing protein [Patescibacteria group bacterium]